jgi:hypothetical protein
VWGDDPVAYIHDRHMDLQPVAFAVRSAWADAEDGALEPPEGWQPYTTLGWGVPLDPDITPLSALIPTWADIWPTPDAATLVDLAETVRSYRVWVDDHLFIVGRDDWARPGMSETLADALREGNRLCGELLQECWVYSQLCSREARRLRA